MKGEEEIRSLAASPIPFWHPEAATSRHEPFFPRIRKRKRNNERHEEAL